MCVSIGKEWVFSDLNLAHSTQGCKLLYVYRNHAQQHTHTSKNNTPGNSFEIRFGDAGLNSTKQQEARLSRTDYCTYFFLPFSLSLSFSRGPDVEKKCKFHLLYGKKLKEIALKGTRDRLNTHFPLQHTLHQLS